MRTLAIATAVLLLAVSVAPTAAAQLPPNPFNSIACAWGGGSGGLLGYVGAMWLLACGFLLNSGRVTYDFACDVVQGGGC